MKVLVTYFSQTGNTEKIARAIYEELFRDNEVQLNRMEETNPDVLKEYDFIFIGSPLHAGNLAGPVKDFLNRMKAGSGQKMAGFITHAATAYPDQDMDRFSEPIKTACHENQVEYKGCFDCQGYLTETMHEMIKKNQKLTDKQWSERVKRMTGHPNEKDLKNAQIFARESLT